jgi:hypothetical protein
MAQVATEETFRQVGKKRVWDMDCNDTVRFPFDWTAWLAKEGPAVQIDTVEWVLSAGVVEVLSGSDTKTATITVKFLTPDAMPEGMQFVTCRMTTNETVPQVRDRSIYLNPVTK